jgi:hypothetical protein
MDDPTRADLRISYLEHRSMRADAARLTELVGAARPADLGRLRALADWFARYEGATHDHHHAEEAVIYPALLERDPSFAEADGQLEPASGAGRPPAGGQGEPRRAGQRRRWRLLGTRTGGGRQGRPGAQGDRGHPHHQ